MPDIIADLKQNAAYATQSTRVYEVNSLVSVANVAPLQKNKVTEIAL